MSGFDFYGTVEGKRLTKREERFIFKRVKNKILAGAIVLSLLIVFVFFFSKNSQPSPQNFPIKKPAYDYMSTFLSRNTKPLGLKEDLALKKLLRQANIKWAIRAGARHVLD